jgi:hypothetical protein
MVARDCSGAIGWRIHELEMSSDRRRITPDLRAREDHWEFPLIFCHNCDDILSVMRHASFAFPMSCVWETNPHED